MLVREVRKKIQNDMFIKDSTQGKKLCSCEWGQAEIGI